jgi:hypothetical protein
MGIAIRIRYRHKSPIRALYSVQRFCTTVATAQRCREIRKPVNQNALIVAILEPFTARSLRVGLLMNIAIPELQFFSSL